jgi:formate dehydrogenase subunit gamma
MRHLLLAAAVFVAGAAMAQAPAPAASQPGPPATFVAPALPKPDESNAERAKTQPGNNAPFWRGVRNSGDNAGFTTLPGLEKGVLVQRFVQYPGVRYNNAGEAWRQVRNDWIVPYGGALLAIALLAMAIFHFGHGPLGEEVPEGGRRIERFTPFERAAHWTNAIAFVVLAVSGLVMAFGKFLLLPWMGGMLFGWLGYALKTLHNFVGPLFVVSLVIVIVTFIRDELPQRGDWAWLKNVRGTLRGEEVPSHRFNAGEKVIFWAGVLLLGAVVVGSGLVLDMLIPGVAYTRGNMQIAHMVHAIAALLMVSMFVLHIYLGTVGMKGAYQAMRTGYVDEHWAEEHHALWAEDIRAGKIPAQRSAEPAGDRLTGRPA